MASDFAFRLSTYVTLALSCLCLAHSEMDLLPDVVVFTVVVLALMVVSFLLEGRYSMSLAAANRMGIAIAMLAVVWLLWHFQKPTGLLRVLPWPAGALPYLGPVLMVLIPAKLFRPKHVGDWWAMQGIGLVGVGLACAITEDEGFAGLLVLYAVAAVWSAALFGLRRWAGTVPPIPGRPANVPTTVLPMAGRSGLTLNRVVSWAAAAAALTLPLFFISPRTPGPVWQYVKGQMETGYAGEGDVDLNMTGEVKVNRDVAFEVAAYHARPDGRPDESRPKEDLDADTYWRGGAYYSYGNGRWNTTIGSSPELFYRQKMLFGDALPALGPNQYVLRFKIAAKLSRSGIVAEPVIGGLNVPPPFVTVGEGSRGRRWMWNADGSPQSRSSSDSRGWEYLQATAPVAEPDVSPPYELALQTPFPFRGQPAPLPPPSGEAVLDDYRTLEYRGPNRRLDNLRFWAQRKLEALVSSGKLPADVLARAPINPVDQCRQVAREDYERVARTFCDYLALSNEYRYGLNLRRQEKDADPIEDFLLNVREGHCERFASGLALMLRAVGVPCQFVMGFRSVDNDGGGKYVVRQEHAHAWVSVLITRPVPKGFQSAIPAEDAVVARLGRRPPQAAVCGMAVATGALAQPPSYVWHWLRLDPTAAGDAETVVEAGIESWFGSARRSGLLFYEDFIVGYTSERRDEMVMAVAGHLFHNWEWYLLGLAVAVLAFAAPRGRRYLQRARGAGGPRGTGLEWYDRFLAALAAVGWPVRPGQTPREYAIAVSERLAAQPTTAELAAVPLELTNTLYRVRYEGRPLTPDEHASRLETVKRFAARLRPAVASLPSTEAPHA